MDINIEEAVKEFLKYVDNFDINNYSIELKKQHSLRVMEISKEIAQNMKLDKEKIHIATLIGLLHDIARFEQYTKFKTFDDKDSFDHADYGVEILNKDIKKYIKTDIYDEIIKKAVKNHNKYKIENELSDDEILFCKIIRDADKIDIMYLAIIMYWKGSEEIISESKISDDFLKQFRNSKLMNVKKDTDLNEINIMIKILSFIFDINFKESFEIIKENDYLNRIIDRFEYKNEKTKKEIEEFREQIINYMNYKLK